MEFPRHLHKADGFYVVVSNDAEYSEMKGLGWADQPPAHVEEPKPVRLAEARAQAPAPAVSPASSTSTGISGMTAAEAEDVIATADAEQLAAMKADELAGKKRKGVLALIDVREADLIGD